MGRTNKIQVNIFQGNISGAHIYTVALEKKQRALNSPELFEKVSRLKIATVYVAGWLLN